MASAIRPIETLYMGYRFRSRLEARWARFFDVIGIKFEYEPQGFELTNGRRYLPDFYLPYVGMYAEVKPELEEVTSPDYIKCHEFLVAGMCDYMLFLVGPPAFRDYTLIRRVSIEGDSFAHVTNALLDIHYKPHHYAEERRFFFDFPSDAFTDERDFSDQYCDAVFAARYERF